MTTNAQHQRSGSIAGLTWGVPVVVGLVLLVLHNSPWAAAWVTAAAVSFVAIVCVAFAVRVFHHR